MKFIFKFIMYLVMKIRKEKYHYLSVPDEIISWIKVDRIMKFGHALPSLLGAVLFVIKLLPIISTTYVEQLEKNGAIIPITVICILIPLLILNGFIIETILHNTDNKYKSFQNKKTMQQ